MSRHRRTIVAIAIAICAGMATTSNATATAVPNEVDPVGDRRSVTSEHVQPHRRFRRVGEPGSLPEHAYRPVDPHVDRAGHVYYVVALHGQDRPVDRPVVGCHNDRRARLRRGSHGAARERVALRCVALDESAARPRTRTILSTRSISLRSHSERTARRVTPDRKAGSRRTGRVVHVRAHLGPHQGEVASDCDEGRVECARRDGGVVPMTCPNPGDPAR